MIKRRFQQIGSIANFLNNRKICRWWLFYGIFGIFGRIFQQIISKDKAKQYGKIKY